MKAITISQATIDDVEILSQLFDDYRQFYQQASDKDGAALFLAARLNNNESVIFLAKDESGKALGFTQLYSSFCSVLMEPVFVLYDLFVAKTARRMGVADLLMARAESYATAQGAAEVLLSTAKDNVAAQNLYEQRKWKRDEVFYHYSKALCSNGN